MRLHAARAGAVLGDAGQLDAAIAIRHQIDVEDQWCCWTTARR